MTDYKVPVLSTERFILRAVTKEDAKDMYQYASDAETTQYTTFPAHTSVENSLESIEKFFLTRPSQGWPEAFAIVDKTTQEMVGTCDFWPLETKGHYEMGYIIRKDYWGKGAMSEVSKVVLDYAFESYPVDTMHLKHVVANTASGKIALKLGFTQLGIEKDRTSTAAGVTDAMMYELTKENYKK